MKHKTYNENNKLELIQNIQQYFKDTGNIPSVSKIKNPSGTTYRKIFGTWSNALKEAGLDRVAPPTTKKKKCLNCGKEFTTKIIKDHKFCSIRCSNTSRRKPDWKPSISREEWKAHLKEQTYKYLTETDFDNLGWDYQRKRIILEQDNKCNRCGIIEWRGEPITLEIDHIDGNNNNNNRNNLEGLCPNCHSLTYTWRGRNKESNIKNKVSDDELLVAIKETNNIRQALLLVGMAAKGKNYERAKRLLDRID